MFTDNRLKQLAQTIRKVENSVSLKPLSADEIRESLADIYLLKKDLEAAYSLLEGEALKRGLADTLLVEKEVKFQIKAGNDKTEYNVEKISKNLPLSKFVKIVNIVDGRAKQELTEEEYKVVLNNKSVTPSEKLIVSVTKMTQKEILAEKAKG